MAGPNGKTNKHDASVLIPFRLSDGCLVGSRLKGDAYWKCLKLFHEGLDVRGKYGVAGLRRPGQPPEAQFSTFFDDGLEEDSDEALEHDLRACSPSFVHTGQRKCPQM